MRTLAALLLILPAAAAADPPPILLAKPDAFKTLVNPACSHCIDEAKRRADDLNPGDPVLAWTRGYSDGGVIPVRFFLAPYRVISDSYGVFVYDPDAGYARGFAPGYTFRFHGWRGGVMVMKDDRDGTIYSCLSGVGVAGPKTGARLEAVPTVTGTWGDWAGRYPQAVAYRMFEKYKPAEIPAAADADSVKSRGKPDPRLAADDRVLGVRVGEAAIAYPLAKAAAARFDAVGGEKIIVLTAPGGSAAAYRPRAKPPQKFAGPKPDKDGVSPPNPGVPAADYKDVALEVRPAGLVTKGTADAWDVAGRCQAGEFRGWTLEPLDAVACKWFAWAAEYPATTIAAYADKPAPPKVKEIAGAAEFLRILPKPFATLVGFDAKARTVTLLLEGEKVAKFWPLEPDAELYVNGYWGRLSQFKPGQRVWAWLKLNRAKAPVAVAMLADEVSEWHLHGSLKKGAEPKFPAEKVAADKDAQKVWLRGRWAADGLPGAVAFAHVFSGELDIMLDHEAMAWARTLAPGDRVSLSADPPIAAEVKTVTPWRERTQLRLVVGELEAADLKPGRRLTVKMTPPVETSYPAGLDRPRSQTERAEWLVSSMYCVCPVSRDVCTGMFYTLASCNPNGCGAPQGTRDDILVMIKKGLTDAQIWDAYVKERSELVTRPHLRP